jgi:hypothetical protein
MMCDVRAVVFQSILRSLATRVPRTILKAEEMFPALGDIIWEGLNWVSLAQDTEP